MTTIAEATVPIPPRRSTAQRMAALTLANIIRSERADLKARLRRGEVDLADVIATPADTLPCAWRGILVYTLLVSARRIGPTKADRIMRRAGVSHRKHLEGITIRQRDALLDVLAGRDCTVGADDWQALMRGAA